MQTLIRNGLRSIGALFVLFACSAALHAQRPLMVYDFELELEPAANIDTVRALGFRGLVTRLAAPEDLSKLEAYARHAATLEHFDVLAFVAYDFANPASPDVWRGALPILRRAGAPLWVIVRNTPSQPALEELVERMARESAAFGVRTVLYPHWDTSIETAAEASVLIEGIGHPNLRNSIHTCHEIRSGNQYELGPVAAAHAGDSALVTIAGADDDAYHGAPSFHITWDDAIRPLDEGAFSLQSFLQSLHDSGYDGPVILQTFGITNNPGHLQRSIRKYAEYNEQLVQSGR